MMLLGKVSILVVLQVLLISAREHDESLDRVIKGMRETFATGIIPEYFKEAVKDYQLPNFLRHGLEGVVFDVKDSVLCKLCNVGVEEVLNIRHQGATGEEEVNIISRLCLSFGIENERVCRGFSEINVDLVNYIIDNTNNLTGKKVCSMMLADLHCPSEGNSDWEIEIPEGYSQDRSTSGTGESFNIVHISDFHYDPMYTPTGSINCGEPLCCQADQGPAQTAEETCGYWTNYNLADTPLYLVTATLERTNNHTFDYVYYTGDIISHRVWTTSIEDNTRDIKTILGELKKAYNVPVYPVLGNHESHPMNQWSSDNISESSVSSQWLYKIWADEMSAWIPNESVETILRGGYYTASPRPGFRVIALNTNVCYLTNFWLLYDDFDPNGQLQWLADTLSQAEENNESVHLIYHVPTGASSCLVAWSRNFRRIIERFANTITGQFEGHSHKDEFQIFYNSSEPTQAISVAFNGASVTPYTLSNPSYKVFTVDQTSFKLLDAEQWTFNLTQANLNPDKPIDWYKIYTFTEEYGVQSLEPENIQDLLVRMASDDELLDKYNRFKYRDGIGYLKECGNECYKKILCSIASSENGDDTQCKSIQGLFDENHKELD